MLRADIVPLQNNTHHYAALRTQELLQQLHWELFEHTPYGPDVAPSDYHLFQHLKMFLAVQHFLVTTLRSLVAFFWLGNYVLCLFTASRIFAFWTN
ncbi:hypothetical protein AVEN_79636-1 [Araneus ventricosus]|uniref:Histone-lysine N-methyltransferase SETMAR n=1 Tax=Araneus ventricosus TaxID=182803 RepID=A0A4Y2G2L2_ARAVE|nr:hypothetical protein AVEN_79636-1 [Araneus ventricosus]